MNHLGKTSVWVVLLFCATNQASLAVGPVEEDFNPPIQCVADGTCHINGCQATPDPDCGPIPENSSPENSSPENSSPENSCNTEHDDDDIDKDSVKLTSDQVIFGGIWIGGVFGVAGSGHVQWRVKCGYYTAQLIGNIHLDNASGKYARMHISYWSSDGEHIATRHSNTVHAPDNDNGHHAWPVNVLPSIQNQIVEAHVCIDISDDGDNFRQVGGCETVYLGD